MYTNKCDTKLEGAEILYKWEFSLGKCLASFAKGITTWNP